MSTPGRRKALKALSKRKRLNVDRVARGEKPIVGGKKVSASSIGLSKSKAKKIKKGRSAKQRSASRRNIRKARRR